MPQPERSDISPNIPLTNILHAFMQKEDDFVHDKVFPMVPAPYQGGIYFEMEKKQFFRSDMEKRSEGSESAGSGFDVKSTSKFYCEPFALHKDITPAMRKNSKLSLDLDKVVTKWLGVQAKLKAEQEWASNYFKTSYWTGSSTGSDIVPSTKWNATGATPVIDIDNEKDAFRLKNGVYPNFVVATPPVHTALKNSAAIIDRLKYAGIGDFKVAGTVTRRMLAQLFEVEHYLVASASHDTKPEGVDETMANIFTGNNLMMGYAAKAPSILEPSAGYIFRWSDMGPTAGEIGMGIRKWWSNDRKSDRVEIEAYWDMKTISTALAMMFTTVLT